MVTNIEDDQKLSMVNDDDNAESENECDCAKCLFDALDIVRCDTNKKGCQLCYGFGWKGGLFY